MSPAVSSGRSGVDNRKGYREEEEEERKREIEWERDGEREIEGEEMSAEVGIKGK